MTFKTRIENVRRLVKRDGYASVGMRMLRKCVGKVKRAFAKIEHYVKRSINTSSVVTIAFYPTGGLGDYIISAKILEELFDLCNCRIFVYAEKLEFGHAIYGNRSNVVVKPFGQYELERYDCDLALMVEHFIHIKNVNWNRLLKHAPELYKRMKYLKENWKFLYVDIPQQCYREMVHFNQCRVQELNRWTELRMGRTFDIANQNVMIPMLEEYKVQYEEFEFSNMQYITLNCGTDAMRKNGVQTKTWPNDNYEKLAMLIKEFNPAIKIIQLGAASGNPLKNMDYHVMGQRLEITKWILKNAVIHVDIEGGLVHLATQLGTRCVVLFGPTPMHMYAYEQNDNICNSTCYGCMGCNEDWAYKCYKGHDKPQCMSEITPDMVMNKISKYIEV